MSTAVTFLTLFLITQCGNASFYTCIPNTQFLWNGRICYCNSMGRWAETSCHIIGRQKTCQPGQIIWEECSQCICQDNGQLMCTHTQCFKHVVRNNTELETKEAKDLCTPYRSYYVNCTLCVCPASGRMTEAQCAKDSSCSLKPNLPMESILHTACIPKVTYVFSCRQCVCSDEGVFTKAQCAVTCHTPSVLRRCIPKTFYKAQCNVCYCPDSGIPDIKLCTKSICYEQPKLEPLAVLINKTTRCLPYKFTAPKCIYCECSSQGRADMNTCVELECIKNSNYHHDPKIKTCSPGEMVAFCVECFCPHSGHNHVSLCTQTCSAQNKVLVLDKILKENTYLINPVLLKSNNGNEICDPGSVYLYQGRYCLCPENGINNPNTCTSVTDQIVIKSTSQSKEKLNTINYEAPCEPHTFVEHDCNTCYCGKNGRIDPKWCTFDDCEAKKVIQDIQKAKLTSVETETTATCIAGSLFKSDCNFCICSDTGLMKDRVCTKNVCTGNDKEVSGNEFICEPSSYYTVDCNICYCPADGIKNLGKCTKNHCEVNFLRSDSCVPGELFCDDCNICICPLNGDKKDKACTNRKCSEVDTTWKKIFKLTQSLLGDHVQEDTTRNLNLCFPGEEFEDGCKVCVCPEMGLREYAVCTPVCEDAQSSTLHQLSEEEETNHKNVERHPRTRRQNEVESCITYNITDSSERQECTPGSMYIIRCRQCICPVLGNINYFCRPLPKDVYCEQAYPNYNYLPMGRRAIVGNQTLAITTASAPIPKKHTQISVSHVHTKYRCQSQARVSDDCFICDCEEGTIILEHCFKNEHDNCVKARATFLSEENRVYD